MEFHDDYSGEAAGPISRPFTGETFYPDFARVMAEKCDATLKAVSQRKSAADFIHFTLNTFPVEKVTRGFHE